MKYLIYSYGCQMNTADSQEMAQPLQSRGMTATANQEEADVILMNTCTVRDQAEHRADSNLGRLREWKAANPERILIVAGCAATRWGDSIQKKYPFIDLVSPATRIEQFPEAVAAVLRQRWNWDEEIAAGFEAKPLTITEPLPMTNQWFGDENTAYVTIMRGCNYGCSYCIVPQVRGREKYRPMPEILDEIRRKTAAGQRQVMLLGQTVNSYYWRPEPTVVQDFADLLRAVNAIDTVEAIRFMSPHPRHMKPHVIAAMAESPKVCRHVHLPLQSGSTRVLTRMKRLYTREEYADIVTRLRQAIPGIQITTDVIVGFPGEEESDIALTLELLERLRLDSLFAFKYSPRPGTVSAEWPDDVPNEVKEERLQRVLALSHVHTPA